MTERVIKFFEWLTWTGEQLTYPFERLIKISKWVHQTTERFFTDDYLSKQSHFTTGHPVSPGMKLLLHLINHNYCLRTRVSIWDCNFSKNYIDCIESFFKNKMHSVHLNNVMQILAEILPAGNLNTRWSVVWQDRVTDDSRLFQLLESLSYLGRFNTNKSKIKNE